MNKLYYLGRPDDGFGWGVANTNLVRELSKFCDVVVTTEPEREFDAPVFVPVADAALNPLIAVRKTPKLLGYCFTEFPLTDEATRNAQQYDVLFAGSTWNTMKLRNAGITQAQTLIQGIDFARFKPLPPSDRKSFVVFSGGKYEYRKGQDYVLAAMRHLMPLHADIVLLTAWHNPWPQSMLTMNESRLVDPAKPFEGLPMDRVFQMQPMPNAETPDVYSVAHVGLFPNRCEAGTNLVMCEFMASSRPVIATCAHGHADVLEGAGPLALRKGRTDSAGWFHPDLDDVIAQLEYAYVHRAELAARGAQCRTLAEKLDWAGCARQIAHAAFD